ncbi:ceramidase domain-containing protein [Methylobacterium organophilum]|uniref:ceramidase domain-containing protein n=1 Tax=Methylobacterium organophilum TaxID=410 RepID=UPI001F13B8A0|nr:ceramidase domain-containing protein [Methylobacterium organophilum]UMY16522.1 ceramidase domain-containing protein [Methylobacterium organophilum]
MDASWFEPVRAYCERQDAGFWAEPLNAVSNAAFLVAAALAWRQARGDAPTRALSLLVGVVGIGSFLFHTFADRWSMLADVIPIGLFIYAYFLLALRRFHGFGPVAGFAATLAFAAFSFGLTPTLDALTGRSLAALSNGSIDYLPALLALFGVGAPLLASGEERRRRAGRALLGAGALFGLSLVFRTMDAALCPVLPTGTHPLWHLCNAAVLFRLVQAARRCRSTK